MTTRRQSICFHFVVPDSEVAALKQQQARAKSILNTMSGTISLTLLR